MTVIINYLDTLEEEKDVKRLFDLCVFVSLEPKSCLGSVVCFQVPLTDWKTLEKE